MVEQISFGTWLRKQRRSLDLTRQAFAAQVGCAEVTLRRIEAGTLKPSKELAGIILGKLGIPESERSLWISFARGLSGFPSQSPTPLNKSKSNLPAQLTTFIGREKEQMEVIRLITKHRLVTLTGSGGVGKTRLSIKVGEQALKNYADDVWLLELASLNDPALLPQTAAALFGLTTQSDIPYIDLIINFLRPKNALLILDNCEHLIGECAYFTDTLLRNCSQLKIIATSREPLGVSGEAIYRVPSLAVPNLQQQLDNFRDFESLKLFEERAQLVQYHFSLTLENVSCISQICHHLDGIPLAIELTAAKIGILSLEQIAKQLEESFIILTGGSRTALPRHRTLRASVNWSWDLLVQEEQILMQQLSVFSGGWTLEAAQEVCDGDVLALTDSLVKKSLIVMNREEGRETRYRYHETVRQYAQEKFVETGEEEYIRTRHLKYFLQLSEQAEPRLRGLAQIEWYTRLSDERDNIRVALEWANNTDVESGLYLSGRLHRFWESFDLRQGNYWLYKFLQRSESRGYRGARAKALYVHGLILEGMQQLDTAHSAAEECLKLYRALGDQGGEVDGLLLLAWNQLLTATETMELSRQALELAESLDDVPRQVEALWHLGYADQSKNRFNYWEKAIKLARSLGDVRALSDLLSTMGLYLVLDGDDDSGQKHLDEADMLYRKFNMQPPPEHLLAAQGQFALICGDYEKARACLEESAKVHLEFGNRHEYLFARVRLGYVALREGNLAEAHQIFAETVQDFQKDKYMTGAVFALEGIASLYVIANNTDHAARLIGWADGTREEIGDLRPIIEQSDVDKITAACIAEMGETAYVNAYDEGRKLTTDEAVMHALSES